MTSETRTAVLIYGDAKLEVADRMGEIAEIAVVKDQTAIPWCTTHDQKADDVVCVIGSGDCGYVRLPCVISTGGPDHKWWKDK